MRLSIHSRANWSPILKAEHCSALCTHLLPVKLTIWRKEAIRRIGSSSTFPYHQIIFDNCMYSMRTNCKKTSTCIKQEGNHFGIDWKVIIAPSRMIQAMLHWDIHLWIHHVTDRLKLNGFNHKSMGLTDTAWPARNAFIEEVNGNSGLRAFLSWFPSVGW